MQPALGAYHVHNHEKNQDGFEERIIKGDPRLPRTDCEWDGKQTRETKEKHEINFDGAGC